jgi:hypothetical protein
VNFVVRFCFVLVPAQPCSVLRALRDEEKRPAR